MLCSIVMQHGLNNGLLQVVTSSSDELMLKELGIVSRLQPGPQLQLFTPYDGPSVLNIAHGMKPRAHTKKSAEAAALAAANATAPQPDWSDAQVGQSQRGGAGIARI
jgi:hypothetical protein